YGCLDFQIETPQLKIEQRSHSYRRAHPEYPDSAIGGEAQFAISMVLGKECAGLALIIYQHCPVQSELIVEGRAMRAKDRVDEVSTVGRFLGLARGARDRGYQHSNTAELKFRLVDVGLPRARLK
ncbi:MAG TPA: hypothetical protein VFI43_01070, partial [Nitrosospira sp.]|nr:hypothetical protein [Nitrosospira sp.]